MKSNKHIALWGILLIWIFQMVFPMLFCAFVREDARNRDLSAENDLAIWVRIASDDAVHWEDHKSEMLIGNAWFDVLEIQAHDQELYVKCIPDSIETEVIQALGGTTGKSSTEGSEANPINANAPMECFAFNVRILEPIALVTLQMNYYSACEVLKGFRQALESPPDGICC